LRRISPTSRDHEPHPETSPMKTPHLTTTRVLLTVEAAAKQLSIGRTTMYGLIKAGQITTVQVGHLRRVPTSALTAYVERLADAATAA
jgi:excisionase family DNA binding protein